LLLMVCGLQVCSLPAQVNFRHYTPLQSEGTVPPEVLSVLQMDPVQLTSFAFKEEYALYRTEKINYLKYVQVAMYEMFSEGRVLFNDTLSRFVQAVAYRLIERNPTLMRELRFYVVKSPAINSFVTENGMVFVTTGLIARCQNEAQLAWNLARCVVHYIYQHRISGQDALLAMQQGTAGLSQPDLEARLLGRRLYAAQDQVFADTAALANYVRAGYDPAEALQALKTQGNLYGFAEDLFFSPVFLENAAFRISQEYLPLSVPDAQPDSKPDGHLTRFVPPKARLEAMQKAVARWKRPGKTALLPQADFDFVVKLARYEQCLLLLASHRYAYAAYQAYLLELDDFANPFLEHVQLRALYGAAKAGADSLAMPAQPKPEDHTGQVHHLVYLFAHMPAVEKHAMALHVCMRHLQRYPSDTLTRTLAQDLAQDLRQRWRWGAPWLRRALQSSPDAAASALDPLLPQPEFTALSLQALQDYAKDSLLYTLLQPVPEDTIYLGLVGRALVAGGLKRPPMPAGYGVPRQIIFARADYQLADLRKTDRLQMEASLIRQYGLNRHLARLIDTLRLSGTHLDGTQLRRDSVLAYNDIARLQLWLHERQQSPKGCLSLCPEYAPSRGHYAAHVAVRTTRDSRQHWPWVLAGGVLVPPLLPAAVYYAVTPAPEQHIAVETYYLPLGQRAHHYRALARADHWRQDLWQAHLHQALLTCTQTAIPLRP
jgi:hypothetical protein